MVDMNRLEGKELRAKHVPSGTWLFACLSGIPGNRSEDVYRVDAMEDQDLDDFELWVVEPAEGSSFYPIHRVYRTRAIYS